MHGIVCGRTVCLFMATATLGAMDTVSAHALTTNAGGQLTAPAAWVQGKPKPPTVTRLVISASKSALKVGEGMSLSVAAYDGAGGSLPATGCTYRVTPSAVGAVANGVFTARKAGSAAIVAVLGKVTSNSLGVTVTEAPRPDSVTQITLSAAKVRLLVGDETTLTAAPLNAEGQPVSSAKVTYRVTPPAAGKVSPQGVFTAGKGGTAQVVAVVGKVSSDPVALTINEITRIDVTPGGPVSLHAGDTMVFTARAYDAFGKALPNDEFPTVPLTWKSNGGQINASGALRTSRPGTVQVTASAGRVRSNAVSVIVGRRDDADSTHLYLLGQPASRYRNVFVTIDRIEAAGPDGVWRTMATGAEIDALVGQPIDVSQLSNQRLRIGTAFLPAGDYRQVRITFSGEEGANYAVDPNGERVSLSFPALDALVQVIDLPLYVTEGYPMNVVLEVRTDASLVAGPTGAPALDPSLDVVTFDDEELERPFGSLVGRVSPAVDGEVFATYEDEWGSIVNYFGTIDAATGQFRISQMPVGAHYELHVNVPGWAEVIRSEIQITKGQDTVLSAPIELAMEE